MDRTNKVPLCMQMPGHQLEFERGPHRGRMLRDGDFALEVTIFEDGVPPEFHVYPYLSGKPLPPSDVNLAIELGRLGNRTDKIAFTAQDDYLKGSQDGCRAALVRRARSSRTRRKDL